MLVGGGWIDAGTADAAGGSERMGGAALVDAVDGLSDVVASEQDQSGIPGSIV